MGEKVHFFGKNSRGADHFGHDCICTNLPECNRATRGWFAFKVFYEINEYLENNCYRVSLFTVDKENSSLSVIKCEF